MAVSLPVLGGILPLLTFYVVGFKKIKRAELILSFFLVAITLFIQPMVQQVPFLALGIESNANIAVAITAIWFGFIAGFFQEGLKYVFVRNRNLKEALFVGIGFGLGEAVLVPLLHLTLGDLPPIQLTQALLSFFRKVHSNAFSCGNHCNICRLLQAHKFSDKLDNNLWPSRNCNIYITAIQHPKSEIGEEGRKGCLVIQKIGP